MHNSSRITSTSANPHGTSVPGAHMFRTAKRVLVFSLNYYPRFIGGAEVAIKEITDRISPEEIEFHVLALRFDSNLPKEEVIGNVHVHRIGFSVPNPTIADLSRFPIGLPNKVLYQLWGAEAAEALHKKYRFDGIWAMMAHASGVPAGIFKTRHPEVKYLLTLQEGDPPEYIENLFKPIAPLFRQAFTSADALQAISTFLLAWGKRMGCTKEGILVPNGVDAERFAALPDAAARSALRARYAREDETLLITTSRLVRKNAVDDVLRALALLPPSVKFLILGIGPEEHSLRALAHELGVRERAHFLGEVNHDELPLYLAASDIFVRPSRSEGLGVSFMETMAAGVPIIATQEGGIADFLFDARRNPDLPTTGWAVDKDSPEQIRDAVKDIIAHPEKVKNVVATAQALAFKDYSWDLVATKMRTLFRRLFSGDAV